MWDLVLNDDQVMIAQSVREYLASEAPLERLRPNAAPRDLSGARAGMFELGWFGLGLPETAGGAGLGLSEEVLIQRECARHLVSPSILASVLGAHMAIESGDIPLARALATGESTAAIALILTDDQSTEGAAAYAFDWKSRDFLVAWTDRGMGLFDAQCFEKAKLNAGLDDSMSLHVGTFAARKPRHWIAATAAVALRAQVLLAARLVGLAEQACDLTVEYAKVRQQFGKPIGSFQAVKHRCADMVVRARLAWYQTALAALKVHAGASDATLHAAAAKLMAAQAAHENARAAIQLHGAIGFQSECDVHWFMKRAHLYEQIGGGMRAQARRIAAEPSPLW